MDTFICELCNYKTNRKYDFNKHLNTKRHKSRKISLCLSSCDKKKSFSEILQKKTTKSEPKSSSNELKTTKNDKKRQKSEPKSSPNELKTTKNDKKRQKSEPKSSPNELKTTKSLNQKSPKKIFQNGQNSFNISANKNNLCLGNFNSMENNIAENNSNFEYRESNLYHPHLNIDSNNFSSPYQNESDSSHEIYECEYCSLEFKTKANLKRHQLKSCKYKKQQQESNLIASLQKDKEKMLEIHQKEKEEYRKQIEILLDKVGTTNITNTNCGNTQTNNVQLNNFGQEDLTMLTDKYMNKMVAYPYSAIPTMIKKIHFNDKYPANRNIRMLNKKDNKLQIRNNGEWQYVNKKETLQLLIEDKNYQLENYYENNKEKFDSTKQNRFESFQDQVNMEEKKVSDNIKKDTELVFWNSM